MAGYCGFKQPATSSVKSDENTTSQTHCGMKRIVRNGREVDPKGGVM